MSALVGLRIRHRRTGRIGTVRVCLHLDWVEVEWDDAPGKLEMLHSAHVEAVRS